MSQRTTKKRSTLIMAKVKEFGADLTGVVKVDEWKTTGYGVQIRQTVEGAHQ